MNKKERLKSLLANSTGVLKEEKSCNSYPFAVGVMKSLITQICEEAKVDVTDFRNALNEHLNRRSRL